MDLGRISTIFCWTFFTITLLVVHVECGPEEYDKPSTVGAENIAVSKATPEDKDARDKWNLVNDTENGKPDSVSSPPKGSLAYWRLYLASVVTLASVALAFGYRNMEEGYSKVESGDDNPEIFAGEFLRRFDDSYNEEESFPSVESPQPNLEAEEDDIPLEDPVEGESKVVSAISVAEDTSKIEGQPKHIADDEYEVHPIHTIPVAAQSNDPFSSPEEDDMTSKLHMP